MDPRLNRTVESSGMRFWWSTPPNLYILYVSDSLFSFGSLSIGRNKTIKYFCLSNMETNITCCVKVCHYTHHTLVEFNNGQVQYGKK